MAEASSRMPPEKLEYANYLREHMTESQRWAWQLLKSYIKNVEWYAEVPFLGWILDFYCEQWRVCIELDGAFHKTKKAADSFRDKVLAEHGVKTVRVNSRLMFASPQAVLSKYYKQIPEKKLRRRKTLSS